MTSYEERDAEMEARATQAALLSADPDRHAASVVDGVLLDDAPPCAICAVELVLSAILISRRAAHPAVAPRMLTLGRAPYACTPNGVRCVLHADGRGALQ